MVYPHVLRGLYTAIEKVFWSKEIIAGKSGRHMKFPYTFAAKAAQFPYFFYLKNNAVCMYYPLGFIISFYFIRKIHLIVNSEENKRSWAETQRRIAEKEQHH
ncbi:unnamed protein product [Leptidea sinapis]|uniref:Uncharacterized protein n=1 Tax=Leptidea sinapis TaxID=189913 RepID=A0A5E4QWY8_9NEOP|nr:unnamed protein product [Leptidea sinapis]